MEKSLFEQMGGTYKQVGDYLLPDGKLPEEKPIGVWGTRHYNHLRKTNRILFSQLTISGKMNGYLADIDKQADEQYSQPCCRNREQGADLCMMTLEDLWYGNVNPHEEFLDGNEKFKERLPIMATFQIKVKLFHNYKRIKTLLCVKMLSQPY